MAAKGYATLRSWRSISSHGGESAAGLTWGLTSPHGQIILGPGQGGWTESRAEGQIGVRSIRSEDGIMKRREFVKAMGALSVAGLGLDARGAIGDAKRVPRRLLGGTGVEVSVLA